jgi:glucosamine--fructose-6-phosphate aminotransferase (isomerizing)
MPPAYPVFADILNQAQALGQSLNYFRGEGAQALVDAANKIARANLVVIGAIGASYNASFPFVYQMAKMGIRINLEDASELLHYTRARYDTRTVFLLISRSGDTIEIKNLLDPLKKLGSVVIGVTNVVDSCLGRQADILLPLNSPADELIAVQTYSATLQALDLLAEQVAGNLHRLDVQKKHDRVVQLVESTLLQYKAMFTDQYYPIFTSSSRYLLARAASLASAYEGQLLFHEMAWQQATAYSAGNFRHGAWEVVDQEFLGFVFAPEDPCKGLNYRLALDIARFGGTCCLISAQAPAQLPRNVYFYPIPPLEPEKSPILEIIPLQLFLYHWALSKGHQPGKFRASTPITLTEGED